MRVQEINPPSADHRESRRSCATTRASSPSRWRATPIRSRSSTRSRSSSRSRSPRSASPMVHGKVAPPGAATAGRRPRLEEGLRAVGCGRKADRVLRGDVRDADEAKEADQFFEPVPDAPDVRRGHPVDRPRSPSPRASTRAAGATIAASSRSWWRGGGHKQRYRVIDFKRDKHGVPAKVATVEYDPQTLGPHRAAALTRTARSATSSAGRPSRWAPRWWAGENVEGSTSANALPLKRIPLGTVIHNHRAQDRQGRPDGEERGRRGASSWRATAPGAPGQAAVRGEVRKVHVECYAHGRPGGQPGA